MAPAILPNNYDKIRSLPYHVNGFFIFFWAISILLFQALRQRTLCSTKNSEEPLAYFATCIPSKPCYYGIRAALWRRFFENLHWEIRLRQGCGGQGARQRAGAKEYQ